MTWVCLKSFFVDKNMRLNPNFQIIKSNDKTFLANIVNGDIFSINDVVECLLNIISTQNLDENELAKMIFAKFDNYSDDFSETDFSIFINDLVNLEIILK